LLNNLFEKKDTFIDISSCGLDLTRIPRHIAIIMDGNGRWARRQGKVRTYGHKVGAETLKTILRFAGSLGVECITAYAFSTENWKRPATEVGFIMKLLCQYLEKEVDELNANNVRMCFSGSREGLPQEVLRRLDYALEQTRNNTGIILNLAINYGSQDEIVRAARKIANNVLAGVITPQDINAAMFADNLYTAGLPDLDLLIRPGGDMRVSNFLLWQIAYAEIWYTPLFWPDFTPQILVEAIKDFQKRDRRYGGLSQKDN